jgi:hypothetical protein
MSRPQTSTGSLLAPSGGAEESRGGKARVVGRSMALETTQDLSRRAGVRVHRDPAALKDHITSTFVPRPSARAVQPTQDGRRHFPSKSVFSVTATQERPRTRPPIRAAPWAEQPSARHRPKVIPETVVQPLHKRRPPPVEPTHEVVHQKKRMSISANTESTPAIPPPRDPSRPVPARYRCTPNLLRFSPRVSTLTPRKKPVVSRSNILSWVEPPAPERHRPQTAPVAPPTATPPRACLDEPKRRAKKHISPVNERGVDVFSTKAPEWHPAKRQTEVSVVARAPVGKGESAKFGPEPGEQRQHFAKKMSSQPPAAESGSRPWATTYTRSPFDPGSARVVKPFSSVQRRGGPL